MPTTLDGFLADERPSLTSKLEDAFRVVNKRKHDALTVTIAWKEQGAGSSERLADLPIQTPNASAVRNVVKAVQDEIHKASGQDPHGYLRVKLVEKGQHNKPLMSHSRALASDSKAEADSLHHQLFSDLREELREERGLVRELVADIRDMHGFSMGAMQRKDETISELAHRRSVGATTADTSSSWIGLVVLGGLVLGWPMIQEAFGIPRGSTLPETAKLIRAKMKSLATASRGEEAPPDGAWTKPAELTDGGEPTADDEAAPDGLPESLVGQLTEQAGSDPKVVGRAVTELGRILQGNPALATAVLEEDPWLLNLMKK